jgi:hypothetical protein
MHGGGTMSNEDLQATLSAIERFKNEIGSDPEKAKAFLVEHGFITPDGELTENYK